MQHLYHKITILITALIMSIACFAHEAEINGISYNLNKKTKEACVRERSKKQSGNITIPSVVTYCGIDYKVTSIARRAFYNSSDLTSVTMPESVKTIGSEAFSHCSNITSIILSETVKSINDSAFFGCSSLKTIALPKSLRRIGEQAFSECGNLSSIDIPESVVQIGKYAFIKCRGLTSVKIPRHVASIGEGVFACCPEITSIIVDKENKYYDSRNNCNAIINTNTNELVSGCMNTVIPNNVKRIGNYAFISCM